MGSLTIVGAGISIGQMTAEARGHIEIAGRVVALVSDSTTLAWLRHHNRRVESLMRFYAPRKHRSRTYREMVEYVLGLLRNGEHVCFVLYGHPGVLAIPPHDLIRRARLENIPARMFAGVSAEDCLFADLGIDPGTDGCQSFEATDFLIRRRIFDPTSVLILWQFGIVGVMNYPKAVNRKGVQTLVQTLVKSYPYNHNVIVYEAAMYPVCEPLRLTVALNQLHIADHSPMGTLFVPPLPRRPVNKLIKRQLGLS